MPKIMSFVSACMDFFGKKEGQNLKEFSAEVKQLTDADRAELIKEFERIGYSIT